MARIQVYPAGGGGGGGGTVTGTGSATQMAYWSGASAISGGNISYGASATDPYLYRQGDTDGSLLISGGSSNALGGLLTLYGESHATRPSWARLTMAELEIVSPAATDLPFIFRNVDDGGLVVSGGQDLGSGFIRLYGETHATLAGRVEIGSTVAGSRIYQSTEGVVQSHPTATSEFTTVRNSTTGSAGYYGGSGSNNAYMLLYGSAHATLAQRIYFGGTRMHFVHVTATSQFILMNDSSTGSLGIYGGGSASAGWIELFGASHGTDASRIKLQNGTGVSFEVSSAGQCAVGGTSTTGVALLVGASTSTTRLTTTTGTVFYAGGTHGSTNNTSDIMGYWCNISTPNASFTTGLVVGYYCSAMGKGGSHTITRCVGFYTAVQTSGTNNAQFADNTSFTGNWGINLATTNASSFAGQVRVASLGVGNAAAATTPGTCQNKIEVFNASGVSLGFIAVYDAIT